MCINDWRLGKLIRSQFTTFSLGVAAVLEIPANPNRVGIMFGFRGADIGSVASISADGIVIGGSSGFDADFFLFTLASHGDLPTRAFTLTGVTATSVGGVTEFFAPADYLAAGLESFKSEYGRFLASPR